MSLRPSRSETGVECDGLMLSRAPPSHHDRNRTRAALAELGGAKAQLVRQLVHAPAVFDDY